MKCSLVGTPAPVMAADLPSQQPDVEGIFAANNLGFMLAPPHSAS